MENARVVNFLWLKSHRFSIPLFLYGIVASYGALFVIAIYMTGYANTQLYPTWFKNLRAILEFPEALLAPDAAGRDWIIGAFAILKLAIVGLLFERAMRGILVGFSRMSS